MGKLGQSRQFLVVSYGATLCGVLSLYVTGGIGVGVFAIVFALTVISFVTEQTRFRMPNRVALGFIIVLMLAILVEWRLSMLANVSLSSSSSGSFAKLLLSLAVVKLFQVKASRDWIFVYLIAFFEIVLAAGIGINILFIAVFIGYVFFVCLAIVLLEIQHSKDFVFSEKVYFSPSLSGKVANRGEFRRVIGFSVFTVVLVTFLAVPLFFALPRFGGAGFGSGFGEASSISGFSSRVSLGDIATLKLSNDPVMRVRVEGNADPTSFYWRGVTLDNFNGREWTNTTEFKVPKVLRNSDGEFEIASGNGGRIEVRQEFYLEPIGSPVLFSLSKPIRVDAKFRMLTVANDDTLSSFSAGLERVKYSVVSVQNALSYEDLNSDPYKLMTDDAIEFLQLPDSIDPRFDSLAKRIAADSGARTAYEKSKAIEEYLSSELTYSLKLKATGSDPLADFLFNIRAGHCEYFASSMVVLLRTQGIAARIVNGFQRGDYNSTSETYLVRQRNAHSWVEVYFPKYNAWIQFDPTPPAGRYQPPANLGITGQFQSYLDALETLWITYFVGFDSTGQESMTKSMVRRLSDAQLSVARFISETRSQIELIIEDLKGSGGRGEQIRAFLSIGVILGAFLMVFSMLFFVLRRLLNFEAIRSFFGLRNRRIEDPRIAFYLKMQQIFAGHGIYRSESQTPLEFAIDTKIPEAVLVTKKYNGVRFGDRMLTKSEEAEVKNWIARIRETLARDEKD